ncbi:MAG: tRNA dihydrouridine synthase DusB [Anaerolineaceae bacterium]
MTIPGRLLLAPMDGFTDSPFRSMCKEHGAALCTSEFINGIDMMYGHPHLKNQLVFQDNERPFCYQIFDDDPQRLLDAGIKLAERKPDLMDINMGCSARSVSNRGAGAGLLRVPEKIKQIACSLVREVPVPVTAKIRLGWDDRSRNYLEVAKILEDCGISAITVHARTRKQGYQGTADWDAIAEVKTYASVPVIGNGDVRNVEDALRLIKHTSCDAAMIGRASLGNPWVFEGKTRENISNGELFDGMVQHLQRMTEMYSPRIGTILFRKHLARYLSEHLLSSEIRQKIFSIEEPQALTSEIKFILEIMED